MITLAYSRGFFFVNPRRYTAALFYPISPIAQKKPSVREMELVNTQYFMKILLRKMRRRIFVSVNH